MRTAWALLLALCAAALAGGAGTSDADGRHHNTTGPQPAPHLAGPVPDQAAASKQAGRHRHRLRFDDVSRSAQLAPGKFTTITLKCPQGFSAVSTAFEFTVSGKSVEAGTAPSGTLHNVSMGASSAEFRFFVADRGDVRVKATLRCVQGKLSDALDHFHRAIFKRVTGTFAVDQAGGFAEARCDSRFWASAFAMGVLDPSLGAQLLEAVPLERDPAVREAIAQGWRLFTGALFGPAPGAPQNTRAQLEVVCAPTRSGKTLKVRLRRPRTPRSIGSAAAIARAGTDGRTDAARRVRRHRHKLRPAATVTQTTSLPPGTATDVAIGVPKGHIATAGGFELDVGLPLVASYPRGSRTWVMRVVNTTAQARDAKFYATSIPLHTRVAGG